MRKGRVLLVLLVILIGLGGCIFFLESKNVTTFVKKSIYPVTVHLDDVKSEYVVRGS